MKPTFGFLLGFPCAAWMTGLLAGNPSRSGLNGCWGQPLAEKWSTMPAGWSIMM